MDCGPAGNEGHAAPVEALRQAYPLMRERFGHQEWWPGETPFEVCVGAILTQNTAWTNVERAISNLKRVGVLEPRALLELPLGRLTEYLRPAGYFNVKARRLRAFVEVLVREYGGQLERLFAGTTAEARQRLLAIHGVGRETADSMLLYAGGHLSFVVDAYTRRIFERHGWWRATGRDAGGKTNSAEDYESIKRLCEASLQGGAREEKLDLWQDYHAQLVRVGKQFCRPREPRCEQCPLRSLLPEGKGRARQRQARGRGGGGDREAEEARSWRTTSRKTSVL